MAGFHGGGSLITCYGVLSLPLSDSHRSSSSEVSSFSASARRLRPPLVRAAAGGEVRASGRTGDAVRSPEPSSSSVAVLTGTPDGFDRPAGDELNSACHASTSACTASGPFAKAASALSAQYASPFASLRSQSQRGATHNAERRTSHPRPISSAQSTLPVVSAPAT